MTRLGVIEDGEILMRLALFGLGYVGCVTAACLADQGHEVVGVDKIEQKIETILGGSSPVVEPGLDAMISRCIASRTLSATADTGAALVNAEVAIICVGTPSRPDGGTDLSYVELVVQQILDNLVGRSGRFTIMLRSTVPPGTMRNVVRPLVEEAGLRCDVGLVFCPEFLRETTAIADFFSPPYSVFGSFEQEDHGVVEELFGFLESPIHHTSPEVAESLKFACNAFHAMKVTFANEIGRAFRPLGVDTRAVMDLFVQDRVLNISPKYLKPGFAYGGSCLPKDVRAICRVASASNQEVPLLRSLKESNRIHIESAVKLVLGTGARSVALMGLSFKEGTDDTRESPFVLVAEGILAKGIEVRIFDESLIPERLIGENKRALELHLPHLASLLKGSVSEALSTADCLVLGAEPAGLVQALDSSGITSAVDLVGTLSTELEQRLEIADDLKVHRLAW